MINRSYLAFAILCSALALSACAKAPDLNTFEAQFDAVSNQKSRIGSDLATTAIGTEIAQAVQNNPQILAAAAGVRAAQANAAATKSGYFPRLTLGATLNGTAGSLAVSPMLQVLQLVYDGGGTSSRLVSARAKVFEQRAARLEKASALTMQAVEAVQNLAAANMIADLAAENQAKHSALLADVQARADAGAGADTDVLQVRVRLADATAQLANARSNLAKATAFYTEVFGTAPKGQVKFMPDAPPIPNTNPVTYIESSPRILGFDAQINAAKANLANAQAAWFPKAQLRGVVQNDTAGKLQGNGDLDISASAGARGEKASAVAMAQAELDALLASRDVAVREIRRGIDDLISEDQSGVNRIAAMQAAVEAYFELATSSQDRFAAGRLDIRGLVDAQRDLFEARQDLIIATRDVGLTGYAALALSGDILYVFGIELPQEKAIQ